MILLPRSIFRPAQTLLLCVLILLVVGAANAQPAIQLYKSVQEFGSKVVNEHGKGVFELYYFNAGNQNLEFMGDGISIQGPDAADFTFEDVPITSALRAAEYVRPLMVGFRPSTLGPKSASVVITTNDPDDPTTSILLTGIGVAQRGSVVTGSYDGYGPGQSTIGAGGDYQTLYEAANAINSHALTGGNWTFFIMNDLPESRRVNLGQPSITSHSLIIRPATGTNPTITFTTNTGWINFDIGSIVSPITATQRYYVPLPIHNLIIDGCSTDGGTSQQLTLANTPDQSRSGLLSVQGDSDFITIRNVKINHYSAEQSETFLRQSLPMGNGAISISFGSFLINPAYHHGEPDFFSIENCAIQSFGNFSANYSSISINAAGEASRESFSESTRIKNNTIQTNTNGIVVARVHDAEITGNKVDINLDIPAFSSFETDVRSGIRMKADPYSYIKPIKLIADANRVSFNEDTPTTRPVDGLMCESTFAEADFQITNNMITGISSPTTSRTSAIRNGIKAIETGYRIFLTIAHNSIHMQDRPGALPNSGSSCSAILLDVSTSTLLNNIAYSSIPDSALLTSIRGNVMSNHNNFHTTTGVIVANQGIRYTSLASWQAATGQDLNSFSEDPFIPYSMTTGSWIGLSALSNPDLHFSSQPGSLYTAPQVPGIITDIDGDFRMPEYNVIGADQPPQSESKISNWRFY